MRLVGRYSGTSLRRTQQIVHYREGVHWSEVCYTKIMSVIFGIQYVSIIERVSAKRGSIVIVLQPNIHFFS